MSQRSTQVPAVITDDHSRITQAILDFVSRIPDSKVDNSPDPATEARRLANRAAQRAALTAGSLALPPGPMGWLTILPELVAIWKIQAQMVSDIAAAYGKHADLGREQMLWCLFRHTAAQAFRDLVVRMGDRLLFRRMSYKVAEHVAKRIGVKISQRAVGKGVSRWLPVVGALGVGAYAYYDTGQVASTAIAMFGGEFDTEAAPEGEALPHDGKHPVRRKTSHHA
ncbi:MULTISPECIES: EcsC family protein [Dyella]|uniref:EcsC family protein n=1 Tax=Dyella TaxID=231454 RepID=UPI001F0F9487|nr:MULTISPECIES: EcsC family protein [Dyella]